MKLWKGSFRDGTRMLSRPAKLLYLELLMLLDDHEGLIPDDMKWLVKNLGVHDARVVRGPLEELIEARKIKRTASGLSNAKVSADLGVEEGDDEPEGGGGSRGEGPAPVKASGSSTRLVHKPVDAVGVCAPLSSDCASTAPPLSSDSGQWIAQRFEIPRCFRGLSQSHRYSYDSEVAAALMASPRARGDPASFRA